MEPADEQQKQKITLKVGEAEAAPAELPCVVGVDVAETEATESLAKELDPIRRELKTCARELGIYIVCMLVCWWLGSIVSHASVAAYHDSPRHRIPLGFPAFFIGLVLSWMILIGRSVWALWRCAALMRPEEPYAPRIISLASLDVILLVLAIVGWGSPTGTVFLAVVLMSLPSAALMLVRIIRRWYARGEVFPAPAGTPCANASPAVDAPSAAMMHDVMHSARIGRRCGAQWDAMKPVVESCMRECHECGLNVFKPEQLERADYDRLSQWQTKQTAIGGAAAVYRRSDGSYVLGDCSPERRYPLPMWTLSAPPFMHGLALMLGAPYVINVLSDPTSCLALGIMCVLHAFGCWLFTRTNHYLLRVLILVFFSMPLALVLFLWMVFRFLGGPLELLH